MLGQSLYWFSLINMVNLQVVSCFNSHAISILILFLKWFTHALVIISWRLPILHQLNSSWRKWATTLWSVIHHRHSSLSFYILNRNRWIDWVVIIGHLFNCVWHKWWSLIKNSILHFETVWVSEERTTVIKKYRFPSWDNFITIENFLKW